MLKILRKGNLLLLNMFEYPVVSIYVLIYHKE